MSAEPSSPPVDKRQYKMMVRAKDGTSVELSYARTRILGRGTFGWVHEAKLAGTGQYVAIKRALRDDRVKNRELAILRQINHGNTINLLYYFYTTIRAKNEIYLNLILEYLPQNLSEFTKSYTQKEKRMPIFLVKLFSYQLFRGLAYLHGRGIAHRDIKPHNVLVDSQTGVLKICDLGSAKVLAPGVTSIAYICSRPYRAPELVLGETNYTFSIDIWAGGCVVAEMMMGRYLFPGKSASDQLVQIFKVLGAPSPDQLYNLSPVYRKAPPTTTQPIGLDHVIKGYSDREVILNLFGQLFDYDIKRRPTGLKVLTHPFFDILRSPNCAVSSPYATLPPLFDFSLQGKAIATQKLTWF
ncbi:glycogen synthase kinase 3 [Entomophthora muscae]|uniref:Glycogen synthase kinase 3 n=1 Tax=Entomophthora muscae TaxID=34485 RepID=A0ACC2TUZ8_9FUNG|nr:glycogen synthase kinase 3 [Entomophthora muscae]